MPKRSAHRRSAKVAHHQRQRSFLHRLADKQHRPLHGAALGTILIFLKGLFAVVGVVLLLIAAFAYILRASKTVR